jgi:predicted glycoside hydrolase/deacetylase ChbG (UPF0249 family)
VAAVKASTTRGLIVCADDFAIHASASDGIVHLARLGRLSATSAMVLSPRWAQDAVMLRELRWQIDVGLHLDWTSVFAVQAGHGMSLGSAMRQALLKGFDQGAASTVITQQLELFEKHWGGPPDFVDGHQHVQQFAGIREALVAVLQRRYGGQAQGPYLRISRPVPGLADLKSRVIAWMGAAALQRAASDVGFKAAKGLLGIYDFSGDESAYAARMTGWLAQAPEAAILMCHPAQRLESGDEIGAARVREFAYLSSTDFVAALAQARVRLARGTDVL